MRLIDADEAMERVLLECTSYREYMCSKNAINNSKTIDAVPVVRCKDCNYYGDENFCPLLSLGDYTDPYDFCSYGERKEGADNG